MNKFVKSLAIGGAIIASTAAFAAPKLGTDMYGIAGVGFNGYESAVSPITIEAGVGQKINTNISAELIAAVTPGGDTDAYYGTCKSSIGPQVGVSARGIYHIPVDFAGVKPYVGAGIAYYMSPSHKLTGCGLADAYTYSGFSGVGLDYTAGLEYDMSNKTKLYLDAGGVGANWGGSVGAKIKF